MKSPAFTRQNFSKNLDGFTLIELLVVIAILSILMGVVIVGIDPAKRVAEARDTQRKQDVYQIAQALEQYFVLNEEYPHLCDRTDSEGGCASASVWRQAGVLETEGFLKKLPDDPINNSFSHVWQGTGNYSYFIVSESAGGGIEGEYFMVGAFLENKTDPEAKDGVYELTNPF